MLYLGGSGSDGGDVGSPASAAAHSSPSCLAAAMRSGAEDAGDAACAADEQQDGGVHGDAAAGTAPIPAEQHGALMAAAPRQALRWQQEVDQKLYLTVSWSLCVGIDLPLTAPGPVLLLC